MSTDRQLDPESQVLSAFCKSPDARSKYLEYTERDDFGIRVHGDIFDTLLTLVRSGISINIDTVSSSFSDAMTRMTATFLFDSTGPTEISPDLFKTFKQGGVRARQIKLRDMIDKAIKSGAEPSALTEQIRQATANLEGQDAAVEAVGMADVVDAGEWVIDQWAKGDRPIISGLPELDDKLFLSQFIGYTVVAGNSGVGKSAFMCTMAKANAKRGIPGTVCSLEMSKELLLIRMAMEDPKVRGLDLTEKTIKNAQKVSDLKYAMQRFRKLPIYIVEGVFDIFRLDKICRKLAVDRGSRYVLFDYIQLGKTKPTDSDVVRVYTVSRYLQGLTKRDIPNGYDGQSVIAFSQYSNEATKSSNSVEWNRDADESRSRNKPKPVLPSNSDLAWSGQIKQDADTILHIRPESDPSEDIVDITLYCGKQRMYKTGWSVPCRFVKTEQMFRTEASLHQGGSATPQERRARF